MILDRFNTEAGINYRYFHQRDVVVACEWMDQFPPRTPYSVIWDACESGRILWHMPFHARGKETDALYESCREYYASLLREASTIEDIPERITRTHTILSCYFRCVPGGLDLQGALVDIDVPARIFKQYVPNPFVEIAGRKE